MKKLLLSLVLALSIGRSFADEGMWLPLLLGRQVYDDMVRRGLRLKPEQLYSANKASIKDAIIIFGGGCTGEIVSNQGLIFTNHHCGYDAIATASSVQNNYLRDGFWAANKETEIPTALTVQFLNRIEDLTDKVNAELGNLAGSDRLKKQDAIAKRIQDSVVAGSEFKRAVLAPMFKNNQFFLFVYDVFKDVRFVGTPPESIGKFGGDTDNWEWPRHTGDFSVFRVYAGPNNEPAAFSRSNKPLAPKYHLPVSIKPLKDGDFSMIFGYPGGTNRYEVSYGVKLKTDIENPTLVRLRDMRLKYMYNEMVKDPAVKLQLAGSYAGIANYWKFFDGESKQLLKYKVREQKESAEAEFTRWAQGKPDYQNLMADYAKNYEAWRPYATLRTHVQEGIAGSPLIRYAASWQALRARLMSKDNNPEALQKAIAQADASRTAFLASENRKSDQNVLAMALSMFSAEVPADQQPQAFYSNLFKNYGGIETNPYRQFAAAVFENTMAFDNAKWEAFKKNPTVEAIQNDPAFEVANAFVLNYQQKYAPLYAKFVEQNNELGRLYLKGIMQMNPAKVAKMYPDANFTMRTSYGNVKSYAPRDAVKYDYVCTMKGAMEKYKPGDYEFDLPKKFVDLYNARDFGPYADPKLGDVVISFITTNDITGGNSGSPVINAKGELIGLAFDGNYEALSHKLAFDANLNRTICVDSRYVLWCIEKLGGAKHIVDELTVVR